MSEQTTERRNGFLEYRGKLALGKRVVRYTTVTPDREDSPSGEAILVVPGFMADENCYKDMARMLTHEGHISVLISHEDADPPAVVEDVGEALGALHDGRVRGAEFDRLHGLGHSLGTKYLLEALTQDTQDVKSFFPMAPAGYCEVHSEMALWSIAGELRHMGKLRFVMTDLLIARNAFNAVQRKKRPGQRAAVNYADNVAETIEMTRQLAKTKMRMVAITHKDDVLINPRKAASGMREAGILYHVPVDTKHATHNAQLHDPLASAVAIDRAIFQSLPLLPRL